MIAEKNKIADDKGEGNGNKKRNSSYPDCPHLSLEGIVQWAIANVPVSSDPHSFHQADVDVSYEYTRENILYWKNHEHYQFKWVKIWFVPADDSKMSIIKIHSY